MLSLRHLVPDARVIGFVLQAEVPVAQRDETRVGANSGTSLMQQDLLGTARKRISCAAYDRMDISSSTSSAMQRHSPHFMSKTEMLNLLLGDLPWPSKPTNGRPKIFKALLHGPGILGNSRNIDTQKTIVPIIGTPQDGTPSF